MHGYFVAQGLARLQTASACRVPWSGEPGHSSRSVAWDNASKLVWTTFPSFSTDWRACRAGSARLFALECGAAIEKLSEPDSSPKAGP